MPPCPLRGLGRVREESPQLLLAVPARGATRLLAFESAFTVCQIGLLEFAFVVDAQTAPSSPWGIPLEVRLGTGAAGLPAENRLAPIRQFLIIAGRQRTLTVQLRFDWPVRREGGREQSFEEMDNRFLRRR